MFVKGLIIISNMFESMSKIVFNSWLADSSFNNSLNSLIVYSSLSTFLSILRFCNKILTFLLLTTVFPLLNILKILIILFFNEYLVLKKK